MRRQTAEFVEKFLREKQAPKSVIDVGSAHVNGDIRELFVRNNIKYLGVDMRAGQNVDFVLNGHDLVRHLGRERFGMVVCFDTLEHDDKFWLTVANCRDVLKKGGYLLIGVPGRACPRHDHPYDYWRFMDDGVRKLFDGMGDVYVETQKDDPGHVEWDEIYGWGKKL